MSAIVPEGSVSALAGANPMVNQPTEGLEAPQQGATQPGSGSSVPAPPPAEQAPEKLSFKQQVGAWAHVHHGKVTKKTEEKEHFQKVLAGQVAPPEGKNDAEYSANK